MNFYIQQSIQINFIKIGSIRNSSVLQIGSTGVIKPASHLFNTGGFIKPAPQAEKIGGGATIKTGNGEAGGAESIYTPPAVPFSIS